MRVLQHSSGDLIVDRRAGFAAALAQAGDHATAAEVMTDALELVPDWAAGWCLVGDYRAAAGDLAGAAVAYRELLKCDRDGVFGAALKLAALGAAPVPAGGEAAYVEALFDDYAGRFETELVDKLGYDGPARLGAMLEAEFERRGVQQVDLGLDLGCGTGLMGAVLRPLARRLVGVDLSEAMVEAARRKGLYDGLHKAELMAFLAEETAAAGVIAAADVLTYCGALPPVLAAVAGRLAPGGLFAFTLERHDGPEAMLLRPSLRYAHSETGAREACAAAGLRVLAAETAPLRRDRGVALEALYMLVARPG